MRINGAKHSDARFKFRQYELRAVLPNLMLAKVSCYMVLAIIMSEHALSITIFVYNTFAWSKQRADNANIKAEIRKVKHKET